MLLIDITPDDIVKHTQDKCAITRAIERITNQEVIVSRIYIWIGDRTYPTPVALGQWMEDLDSGLEVKPFSFVLGIPTIKYWETINVPRLR